MTRSVNRQWMNFAFSLAERGRLGTSPNPMVGAVIVSRGTIVGRGWHRQAGEPHAEAVALEDAGSLAEGAELYVTLEPCPNEGRTPPCTDAIIAAGIKRVFIAGMDPNPEVEGGGAKGLEDAGIEVIRNVDPEREAVLNERFHKWARTGRPFVTLKMATSLDGKIATKSRQSKWITGLGSRARVQLLREEYDAVGVGVGTLLADDPRLTRRLGWNVRPFLRVIFDRKLETPPSARIFESGEPVLIAANDEAPSENAEALMERGAEIMRVPEGVVGYERVLDELGGREITGFLLEGGATLASRFIQGGLVDRWIGFVAPMIIGGDGAPGPVAGKGIESLSDALRLREARSEQIGPDFMLTGVV